MRNIYSFWLGCLMTSVVLLNSGCGNGIDGPPPQAGNNQPQAAPPQKKANEPQEKQEEKVVGRAALVNMNAQGKGNIGKQTQIVVDFQQAMEENPKLRRVDPKFKAEKTKNPVGLLADIASKKRAQVSRFGMMQMVQLHKAEHDRFPTHKEFMQIMKETGSGFAKLPDYQTYAYDSKTGEITVLIDDEKKQELINQQSK